MLGVLTWKQSHIYADHETLWQDTVAKNPACWMAHINLGNILAEKGQIDEAIRQYQEAIRLKPDNADAHNNLGIASSGKAKSTRRSANSRKPSACNRITPWPTTTWGCPRRERANRRGDPPIPGGHPLETEITPTPTTTSAPPWSGKAKSTRRFANSRKPSACNRITPTSTTNLGIALCKKGKIDEAISQFREAIRLKPDDAYAKNNLEKALEMKK